MSLTADSRLLSLSQGGRGAGGSKGGPGGLFGFGQSTAKVVKGDIGVTFK